MNHQIKFILTLGIAAFIGLSIVTVLGACERGADWCGGSE